MLRRPEQKLKTLADRVFACVIGLDGPVPKIIERADQRSKAFKPPKCRRPRCVVGPNFPPPGPSIPRPLHQPRQLKSLIA